MRRLALALAISCLCSTTTLAVEIAISTQGGWMGQGTADAEAQEIVDNVTGAPISVFTSSDHDALATWVRDHTGDGVSDLLILFGIFPDTIYPAGNAQPDGSLAELFLDDGNCIVNTGDYIFYVGSVANNDAGGLTNMMDVPAAGMWGDDSGATTFEPTADGQLYTPSLPTLPSNRPWIPAQFDGTDWEFELTLAESSDGSQAHPAILRNAVTGGRVGVFFQWNDDSQPRGEVISEWVNNWYLLNMDDPGVAGKPAPANQAIDVPRDVALSWNAGAYAVAHDVYVGTVFDDVNDASRANPMNVLVSQGQSAAAYQPADVLQFSQTYYWRVDEVNGAPDNTIFKGDVWSFTVEPLAYEVQGVVATSNAVSASAEGPENTVNGSGLNADGQHSTDAPDMWLGQPAGADPVAITYDLGQVHKLHEMLVWNYNVQFELMLGFGLKDVTVEYSANGVDWAVLGDVVINQATAKSDYTANTTIDFGGVPAQFVRLTVLSGHGMLPQYGLSEVRFTQIPAQAREPQPGDGDRGVMADATLTWRAGREAVTHDVYLSTDEDAVADGTALAATVETPSYTPGDLEFGATYFWKIDSVNEADAISVWEGAVWSFATQEYAVIDDMESYDDDENRIYDTWIDGFGVDENGSQVGYLEAPFAETSVVNSGSQAMPLFYDNSGAARTSEAVKDLGGVNLATNGADSLRLFIAGAAPGFLENADGTILMNGIGNDIWDAADQFRYAYKQLTGDGSMIARVDALDNSPSGWAKAGVMIRQNDAVGSVHSFMAMTGGDGNGASWQGREVANAGSVNNDATSAVAPPYWVRIDRAGDTLTGYISPDGDAWTQVGDARTIAMDNPVLVGLALTSHNVNQATSATFSNVSITGASGAWQIAEIGATQPTGNDPQPIYVALGNAVVTHPDPAATAKSGWTEWVIPLSEFGNVSNVQSMTIGVGDPSTGGSASGVVFIDDIGYGRPAPDTSGVNLLINGGFEDGVLDPWGVYGDVTSEIVALDPIEGDSCLRLVVNSAGANIWDAGMTQRVPTYEQGKVYTLSAFVKCATGTMVISFKPELPEAPYTAYGVQDFTMTDEWTEFSTTTPVFTADVDPAGIAFHFAASAGEFWIDGVRLYEGDYVAP